jgi:hypothetical protein
MILFYSLYVCIGCSKPKWRGESKMSDSTRLHVGVFQIIQVN